MKPEDWPGETGTADRRAGRRTAGFGFWSAAGACAASVAYAVPQLLQVTGLLPTPLDRYLIFAPSLALAPLFVMAVAATMGNAAEAVRARRAAAAALSILYAAMVSPVYAVQLGSTLPREAAGRLLPLSDAACCAFRAPLTAVDLLGYTYMSLATLVLAGTFPAGPLRWSLLANGFLAPMIFLQLIWPILIYPAAAWLLLFPAAMALLARDFSREVS